MEPIGKEFSPVILQISMSALKGGTTVGQAAPIPMARSSAHVRTATCLLLMGVPASVGVCSLTLVEVFPPPIGRFDTLMKTLSASGWSAS